MDDSINLNTRLLRDQVFVILEEAKIAQQLHERIERLINCSDDSIKPQCRIIQGKVDNLIRYYKKMAETLENISAEAIKVNQKIAQMIQDDRDEAKNKITHSIR